MNTKRRKAAAATAAALLVLAIGGWWQQRQDGPHYLETSAEAFAVTFAAPPGADSAATRIELDELLALQAGRSPADVENARADRNIDITRFYGALGIDAGDRPSLPHLEALAERVEDEVAIRVRVMKKRYLRQRPYVIEPRLDPCIDDVRADRSYPSGHSAWGHAMAYLLTPMVPERAAELRQRAEQYARQRMVCGVHFRSDLESGRLLAERTLAELHEDDRFRKDAAVAAAELRGALGLGPLP